MGTVFRRTRAGIAAAALASALAACGGSTGDTPVPTPAAQRTAPPTAGASLSPEPGASPAPGAPLSPAPGATLSPAADVRSAPARAAAPAAKGAPTRTFPVAVRRIELSRGKDRPLPTTIWYPRTGDGPFPVIVFSHGLTSQPQDYARLLSRWAGAGFVVVGAAYPHTSYGAADFDALDVINQPADASYVLSRVLALDHADGDVLAGRLATTDVAAAGHSAGGITTVGLFSGNRDRRLKAGIVMAGRQVLPAPFTGPEAPLLFVHGRQDRTVPYADGLTAYRAVPWPKAMMAITAGGHVTTARDFGVVAATTTDFWRWSLYGDRAAQARLARDATAGRIATFTDDL